MPKGSDHPMEMGCYGIGITRTVAAAIEQHNDANGIMWPSPSLRRVSRLFPSTGMTKLRQTAEQLYTKWLSAGVEVMLDDRDERPGVKFKDAD